MKEYRTLPRRERERCCKRQEMLEAAKAVFAEKSYTEATVEEIAERAQFGKGTIYLYFKGGKQEILSAILDEHFKGVQKNLTALIEAMETSAGTSRRLLAEHLTWLVQHLAENREIFIVATKEADRNISKENEAGNVVWGGRFNDVLELLSRFFTAAVRRGEIRPVDPSVLAGMFLGLVRGYLTLMLGAEPAMNTSNLQEFSRQTADFLVSMFFDGAAASTDGQVHLLLEHSARLP